MSLNNKCLEEVGYLRLPENGKRLKKARQLVQLLLAIIIAAIAVLATIIYQSLN